MNKMTATTEPAILPIGLSLKPDAQGLLINPCSKSLIVAPWSLAIAEIIAAYRYYLKQHLIAIYVRGSVARGTAVAGVSDLDTFAVMNVDRWQQDLSWLDTVPQKIGRKYDFHTGIEMQVMTAADLKHEIEGISVAFTLKTLSVCVWGEDIAETLPAFALGPYLQKDLPGLAQQLDEVHQQLGRKPDDATVLLVCQWIMKIIVRAGYALVMRAENSFSRDLFPCYAGFSRHYPQLQPQMQQALLLALRPTTDLRQIDTVLSGIGCWLSQQARDLPPDSWLLPAPEGLQK